MIPRRSWVRAAVVLVLAILLVGRWAAVTAADRLWANALHVGATHAAIADLKLMLLATAFALAANVNPEQATSSPAHGRKSPLTYSWLTAKPTESRWPPSAGNSRLSASHISATVVPSGNSRTNSAAPARSRNVANSFRVIRFMMKAIRRYARSPG